MTAMDGIRPCDCPAEKPPQRDTDGLCFRCSGKLPLTAEEIKAWAREPAVRNAVKVSGRWG